MTRPRLRPSRRRAVAHTLPLLLTSTEVLNLLTDGAPTLTTGMWTCPSRLILPLLTVKDVMNIVLMPCCIGRLAKNPWCTLVALTRRKMETLQLVLRTTEPTLVKTRAPN